ncbi:MAG: hypothetical protein ACR2KT_09815 [Methylocella sp.]|nr:MAG: hypothetical protein DLM68_08110 [Hyphomicrobiales bacterium]
MFLVPARTTKEQLLLDLVFLLLIPATARGKHLAALVAVSSPLRDKEFAAILRSASSVAVLYSLLCDPQHSRSSQYADNITPFAAR